MDDTDLSEALARAGLACHYRRYSDDPALERAEGEARAAGRGFWARGASQPRCVTRSLISPAAPAYDGRVVGNVRSRVYHAPSCSNATCRNCTQPFATPADAEAAGYRPAGDCLRPRR